MMYGLRREALYSHVPAVGDNRPPDFDRRRGLLLFIAPLRLVREGHPQKLSGGMLYNREMVGTEGGFAEMEAATFFKLCWQYGVWVFGPMMVIGVCVLVFSIVMVIRVVRTSVVATLPLVGEQTVEFEEPGRYVLSDEGPLVTFRFRGLRYELVGPDGAAVAARPTLFRAKTSGFTSSRVEVRVFTVTQPGRHVLRVEGLGEPKENDAHHHFVLTRPHLFASMLCLAGILAGAFMTIGGLVLFILRLLPEGAVQ